MSWKHIFIIVLVTGLIMLAYCLGLVLATPAEYMNPVKSVKVSWFTGQVHAQVVEPSLEDKIRDYDWDDDLMIAVAKWESSGHRCELNPSAINDANANGSLDSGLFQVNSIHGYSREYLMDVDNNIEVAYEVYLKQGITAWVAYNNGAYLNCL